MPTLGELATFIDAQLVGDALVEIDALANIESANARQLSYASGEKNLAKLKRTQAGAVIISKNLLKDCPTNALVVENAHLAFAKITHYFKQYPTHLSGVHTSAKTNNAKLANNCSIGENVLMGKNCTISAHSTIEDNVTLGDNVYLYPNVTILQGCSINNNTVVSPGVVIGSEGFGNARDEQGAWHSIAHLGNVVIGNDVTIGANSTIDRGTLEDTQIHNGVRIDNLVHIAHNVVLGENTAIAAGVIIGGSATLGKRCMIGGGATIASHIRLTDDAIVTGASTVDKHLSKPGHYTGFTSISQHSQWKRMQMWLLKLDKITRYLNIKLKHLKD